jgi:hypothetical protein
MSLVALSMIPLHLARAGNVRETDEGTEAHVFQLLIVAEVPIVLFFASKWLPRFPRAAMGVLALQALGVIAAFALLYWFEHFAVAA